MTMTPERWQRVKELFEAALERVPAERSEFLREACGEDEALRAELESLLAEERVVGGFLSNDATKTMQANSWNIGAPAASTLPTAIGHYRIVGFVGKGGMAVVYKAEQQEPRRIVALSEQRFNYGP
jgi:eukaryotic-like serine/threonine-protein kinase